MKKFFERNTVQSLLALILVGVTAYLFAVGQEVPKELLTMTSLVLGYYFRTVQESVREVRYGRASN